MICQRVGCGREATHAPKVCVPGLSGRAGGTPAVETVLSLACCASCVATLGADDFVAVGDRGRECLRRVLSLAAMPRALNFAEAWVEPVELTAPEALIAERAAWSGAVL